MLDGETDGGSNRESNLDVYGEVDRETDGVVDKVVGVGAVVTIWSTCNCWNTYNIISKWKIYINFSKTPYAIRTYIRKWQNTYIQTIHSHYTITIGCFSKRRTKFPINRIPINIVIICSIWLCFQSLKFNVCFRTKSKIKINISTVSWVIGRYHNFWGYSCAFCFLKVNGWRRGYTLCCNLKVMKLMKVH